MLFLRFVLLCSIFPSSKPNAPLTKRILIQNATAKFDSDRLCISLSVQSLQSLNVTVTVLKTISRLQGNSILNVRFVDGSKAQMKNFFNTTMDMCKFLANTSVSPLAKLVYDLMRSAAANHLPHRCPIQLAEYNVLNFRMNGTLLPHAIPNLAFHLRYDLFNMVPTRKWIATLIFDGLADNRMNRKRIRN